MNRRAFLTITGVAAAAPVSAQVRRVRAAFIGASHSHAADKVRITMTSPDYELAGIFEPNKSVAETYRKSGAKLLSKQAILGDPSIEVILVESGVREHEALGLEAIEAGKHLHLEKPPSDNAKGLPLLLRAARKKNRLLQQGYMWRYHPGFAAMLEAARAGLLGDIYLVKGQMNTLIGADRRPEWALFHGGQMFEQGGHLIDPLVRLMGRPSKVTPFLRHHGNFDDSLLDNTAAIFEYPKALGIINSSVLQPDATPHRSFEIYGSRGSAILRPIEGPPNLEIHLTADAGPYKKGRNTVPLPAYRRYENDLADLANCVRSSKPLPIAVEQELAVQDALLAASEMR
jgi:predicted dehydrogenase